MTKNIFYSLAVCSLLIASVAAQEAKPAPEVEPATATIYIYKGWHVATLWRAAFAVYLDEKMIARLDRGIYLVARVSPGRHTFRTKNKKAGGVELDLKAGETYYLRMDTESGAQVTNPRLSVPAPEQVKYDLQQMKAIEPKDIKDSSIVSVPLKSQVPILKGDQQS